MPDISMCKGGFCPLKLHCHRATAKPEELGQSYFGEPPYKMNIMLDDHFASLGVVTTTCAYFWNNEKYEDEKPKFENK